MAVEGTLVCGCSGVRCCLLCEKQCHLRYDAKDKPITLCYDFCITCARTIRNGSKCKHAEIAETPIDSLPVFDGICVIENFVSEEEESLIVAQIDKTEWKISQSGRRKQDYGPQVNFKKRKLKLGGFNGLPPFSRLLVERMQSIESPNMLSDFQPVELCNLEYVPERGSSIDPHIDDEWLWGERLITLNLLSPTVLTFSNEATEIAVPLPRYSLIIVSGPARHHWKHAIKRQDIMARRIAITLRELSVEFGKGSSCEQIGSAILDQALTFQGMSVHYNLKQEETKGKISEETS